ncbi:alpha-beta hydrolase superfamily lysophospholipase [Prosthecobacter fusiformis]|uniref:Alpha-beta hydrolase superfamily lysophospholipase n=1 Tax=Prosthecobacter fusiformis TaxID=48464 RepID=A0A4R7S358_9BACT|nr:alpha/beta fold hydrolase [Prosthecobacter fusiformis]TDU72830.1 alpha-beta hydrolase superfamily lysophospholipase [Prosthecobacter fusiformis]
MTNPVRRMPGLCLLLLAMLLSACSSMPQAQPRPELRPQEWVSYDGKVMPSQTWAVPVGSKPRGIVIAVHGLSGASSDYWLLGERLPAKGYTVYAYNVRGQGKDPVIADRGDIKSSRQWLRDLETFHLLVRRQHPGVPVFWYGESLGSLICLHTAASRLNARQDPAGIVLASPVAGLKVTVSGFKRFLLETAATLSPRSRYSLGDLAGVDEKNIQVTNKTTHGSQMAVTEHHISSFTLRLLTEIGGLLDTNPNAAKRLRMPVLFLATPNDILSSPDQVQTLFSQVRSPSKRLLWYTRSYHLLLHDVQREEVAQDLARWLDLRAR